MVKHEATQTCRTCAVKGRTTDLSAAWDHKVTVAGGPNTDQKLRAQTQSQADRHQNRGTDGRREYHRAKAETYDAEDNRRRACDIGEVVNEYILVRIKEGTSQPGDTEYAHHTD